MNITFFTIKSGLNILMLALGDLVKGGFLDGEWGRFFGVWGGWFFWGGKTIWSKLVAEFCGLLVRVVWKRGYVKWLLVLLLI